MAKRCGAPVVATNEVIPRSLSGAGSMTCWSPFRHRAPLETARPTSSQLRAPPEGRATRCARCSKAMRRRGPRRGTSRCECDLELNFRGVRFPGYPVPDGETPFSFLYSCASKCSRGSRPITPEVARRLQRELEVIRRQGCRVLPHQTGTYAIRARAWCARARAAARPRLDRRLRAGHTRVDCPSSTTSSSSGSCTKR